MFRAEVTSAQKLVKVDIFQGGQIMKSKCIFCNLAFLIVILSVFLALATVAGAQEKIFHKAVSKPMQWYKPDELIVKFKAGISEQAIEEVNLRHGVHQISRNRWIGFRRLKAAKRKNIFDLAAAYSKNPNVEYARPNYVCRAFFVPNDQFYSYQWHFPLIGMEQAWGLETGDPSIVVAVVDTGVAYEDYTERIRRWRRHYYKAPDLAQTSFVPGYDFINNDEHPNDDEGHGTHITGTIAQSTNNNLGCSGIAFNCSIMPVKVLGSSGSGTVDSLANGITFAADNGAKVINMSLGFSPDIAPEDIPAVTEAVQYAYNRGCVLVASSGNDEVDIVSLPAAYPEVIAVGAVHSGDERADYSQYGTELELVAPGGDTEDRNGDGYMDGVLQQTFGNSTGDWGYWFYTGTSCAAPHVSGVAALLISKGVATTPEDVRQALQDTAVDKGPAGWDEEYGWGRVDAFATLQWTSGPVDNPPAVNITAPADGDTVSGIVTITADATDDIGVAQVDFYYDSNLIGTDTASPYSVNWDTTTVDDSAYTITASAVDTASQIASDSISIIVDNTNDSPVADAGPDQTASDADGSDSETITLDGSGSYDPDGDISSYEWSEDGSSIGTGKVISYDFAVGTHNVTLTVTDNEGATGTDTVIVNIVPNQSPTANASSDKEALVGQSVNFDGFGSSDPDGSIVSYSWDFDASNGVSEDAVGMTASHTYSTAGTYTVTLTVTDNGNATNQDTATVTVSEELAEIEVFSDSFETGLGNWTQDSQNDWFRSSQRATDGSRSVEVDGRANDAQLISNNIDLQGKTNATINFFWFIERGLDSREHIAFDVSTDGGSSWIEKARLRGNVDPENTWHNVSIGLNGISGLKIRFRAKMSHYNEDANVDMIRAVAY